MKSIAKNRDAEVREAIRKIALGKMFDHQTGALLNTRRITGFVKKIHSDSGDELYGTVDVQEFMETAIPNEDDNAKIGYHEGVFLSAIQDNSKGMLIIPKLYSEVTIAMDPVSKREFVTMFSHVDLIQMDAGEKIQIGVTEKEPFDENSEDGDDIPDLKDTGVHAKTVYAKDSISTEIADKSSSTKIDGTVSDLKISTGKGKTSAEFTENQSLLKTGSSMVKVSDGTVYVGSDSSNDDAVLGGALADILMNILDMIVSSQTTTMMGPQPFIQLPKYVALKVKINQYKAMHTNFLTKKVKIQK